MREGKSNSASRPSNAVIPALAPPARAPPHTVPRSPRGRPRLVHGPPPEPGIELMRALGMLRRKEDEICRGGVTCTEIEECEGGRAIEPSG